MSYFSLTPRSHLGRKPDIALLYCVLWIHLGLTFEPIRPGCQRRSTAVPAGAPMSTRCVAAASHSGPFPHSAILTRRVCFCWMSEIHFWMCMKAYINICFHVDHQWAANMFSICCKTHQMSALLEMCLLNASSGHLNHSGHVTEQWHNHKPKT